MVAITNNCLDHADVCCRHCNIYYRIVYNREDMMKWLSGSSHIQDALPYLTNGERELLLSNTCNNCFNKMFLTLDNSE